MDHNDSERTCTRTEDEMDEEKEKRKENGVKQKERGQDGRKTHQDENTLLRAVEHL